jgi:hypothetical protein
MPDNELSIPVLHIDLEGITHAVLALLGELGVGVEGAMDRDEKKRQMAPLEVRQ